MLIIIEGPDGSGKTTLTKKIIEKFNFQYYKENLTYHQRLLPDYNGYKHYFELLEMLRFSDKDYVCDRLHLGDFVNPLIYKDGRDPLTIEEIEQIEFGIRDNTILIGAIADQKFIRDSLSVRGDDVAQPQNIKYMNYLYKLAYDFSTIKNKILWDVSQDKNYLKIFSELEKKLKFLNKIK
jgi:adenylate kinase family enzyme